MSSTSHDGEAVAQGRPPQIVFVAGASRSGTTMLALTLGLHSRLQTLQETHYFGEVADLSNGDIILEKATARKILARLLARQSRGFFTATVLPEDYAQADSLLGDRSEWTATELYTLFSTAAASAGGKTIPVEQTPRNIYYARALLDAYPEARMLEIIRDPRAVLYSQRKRWSIRFKNRGQTPLKQALRVYFNYHAVTMSTLWKTAARAGLSMQSHPRFMSIHYEQLVEAPEATLRSICEFLGIPFEETLLQAPHTTSSTRAVDGARGFYTSSLHEWDEKLPRGDRILCERLTSEIAAQRGYQVEAKRWRLLFSIGHLLRYPLHIVGTVLLNPQRLLIQLRSVLRPSR